jgi:hypothetical protein
LFLSGSFLWVGVCWWVFVGALWVLLCKRVVCVYCSDWVGGFMWVFCVIECKLWKQNDFLDWFLWVLNLDYDFCVRVEKLHLIQTIAARLFVFVSFLSYHFGNKRVVFINSCQFESIRIICFVWKFATDFTLLIKWNSASY